MKGKRGLGKKKDIIPIKTYDSWYCRNNNWQGFKNPWYVKDILKKEIK